MKKVFGKRFKELRLEKAIEQKQMAKLLGVSQQTISRWENDIVEPDFNSLIMIADYFDVTTDYLLGRVDF